MFERSDKADNALALLHDEEYERAYDDRSLNADGFVFVGGRPSESLCGDWRFTLDLYDTGLRQKWFALETSPEELNSEPWDYDPFVGETAPVPSCWNVLRPEWYLYEGSAWYTREIESSGAGRRLLRVGAAQYDTRVFLNGCFLGNHRGGSTPFFVWLELKAGTNRLQLCVNNRRSSDRVPMHHCDWFNYGGLYREVELFKLPSEYVKDLFVSLVPDGTYRMIRVDVEVVGKTCSARFEIPSLDCVAEIDVSGGRGSVTLELEPRLWSPEDPFLYDVSVDYAGDRVSDRVGFREILRQGRQILLNGQEVFFRGISVHEDDLELGKVSTEADVRRRYAHAKELGCNFVRLAHYPHHEMAARIADELGLMLWEELPVYWAIDFGNPETLADASNQLRELILRDRNRASVVIWSVGNENADTDERLAFMSSLCELARELDPTRLLAAACLVNLGRKTIEDRLADHLDIIGINEYYGWYYPNFEELIEIGENSDPSRPVVISEMGAGAPAGRHGERTQFFTEEHMAWVYERQLSVLAGLSWVRGISPWILYDFRTERRQNRHQKGWNRKGLIAPDKVTRKLAFEVLREFYSGLMT